MNTLRSMQHHIRTAHGDSKTYYSGSFYKPLQGGGQGNGAAGPMCLAISIIMLAIIDNFHISATMVASISLSTIYITAVMYIDDTYLLLSGEKGEESQSLITKAQALVQKWCSILWITGGCLCPDKCWWFLVEFKWLNSKWKYKN